MTAVKKAQWWHMNFAFLVVLLTVRKINFVSYTGSVTLQLHCSPEMLFSFVVRYLLSFLHFLVTANLF